MVPEAGGVRNIAAVTLDVFNPRTGAYEALASDPLQIRVEGAAAAAPGTEGPVGVERFRGGHPLPEARWARDGSPRRSLAPRRPLRVEASRCRCCGTWASWVSGGGAAWREANPAEFRRRRAARNARRALSQVTGDGPEAAARVGEALTEYAAARLGGSRHGFTPESAARRLEDAGAAARCRPPFSASSCPAPKGRASPRPGAEAARAPARGRPPNSSASLEAQLAGKGGGRMRGRRLLALLVMAAGVGTSGTALSREAPAAEAAAAARSYDAGDYESAAASYRRLLVAPEGLDRAALHYNLGNAEYRTGRLGYAMLHWERSLAIRPGDGDARANVALARAVLESAADRRCGGR